MYNPITNTKKADQRIARQAAERAYADRRYTYTDIWYAYEKPSVDKCRAWQYCKELRDKYHGYDLLIASKNTFFFTAVFKFADPKTGELSYAYITRDYDRFCHA